MLSAVIRPSSNSTTHSRKGLTRGISLLESLIAVALLVVVVTAILAAMDAGRRSSDEGRRLTMSALAAEMLLARVADGNGDAPTAAAWLAAFTSDTANGGWDGHAEASGAIRAGRDPLLPLLPVDYQDFNLRVLAKSDAQVIGPPLSVRIDGVRLEVQAVAMDGRPLATIGRFVPLPQHLAEVTP